MIARAALGILCGLNDAEQRVGTASVAPLCDGGATSSLCSHSLSRLHRFTLCHMCRRILCHPSILSRLPPLQHNEHEGGDEGEDDNDRVEGLLGNAVS